MAASVPKLWLEFVILFLGLPLIVRWNVIPIAPIFILFAAAGYGLFICRTYLRDWEAKSRFNWRRDRKTLIGIGWRFGVLASVVFAYVLVFHAEKLFNLAMDSPLVIVLIAIFYPLLSVIPQEFLYRSFFFHRYARLFSQPYAMVLASALVFAYLHIIYSNLIAVGLSFCGGLLFSYTYWRTRSLLLVSLEHFLYGLWIFVVGLGEYFYINLFVA